MRYNKWRRKLKLSKEVRVVDLEVEEDRLEEELGEEDDNFRFYGF